MLHLNIRSKSIFIITFIWVKTVNAESISEWPVQGQIETAAFESRFIEIFKSQPKDLTSIYQGMVRCDLADEKARKISGTSKEILESPFKNNPTVDMEIDVDIGRLNILSTPEGCAELKTVKLQDLSNKVRIGYQVPPSFKTPYMMDVKYTTEQNMTMQISGKAHESETNQEVDLRSIYIYPKNSTHPDFPQEIYSMTDMKISAVTVQSYAITFVSNSDVSNKVTLSRSTTNGVPTNSLMIHGKNDLDQAKFTMYGKDMVISMLNGKMHGLMSSKNPLYKVRENQDPVSYTCHNMGERVNIFKVTSDNDCITVTKDQIGEKDVYMDAIYKIGHNGGSSQAAAKRLASKGTSKATTQSSLMAQARKTKKKKLESHFNQLISGAKCRLANNNWAYTGGSCKKGLAHGKGSAEDRLGLKYIGTFNAGNRVKGEIHQNGEMIFSGELVDDKPSGSAICLYEKEYEECRFFRGKRIDTLYKLRKENIKNQEKMAKLQKENRTVVAKTKESSNFVVDALEKEAGKRAASFIFDQLF